VEEPGSRHPKHSACGINPGVGNSVTLARPPVESDKIFETNQLKIKVTQPMWIGRLDVNHRCAKHLSRRA
jgi:hypothetical protein